MKARRGGFFTWLRAQTKRDDPVGDLAGDYLRDDSRPNTHSFDTFVAHMTLRGACSEAVLAAHEAHAEWRRLAEERTGVVDKDLRVSLARRCDRCGGHPVTNGLMCSPCGAILAAKYEMIKRVHEEDA